MLLRPPYRPFKFKHPVEKHPPKIVMVLETDGRRKLFEEQNTITKPYESTSHYVIMLCESLFKGLHRNVMY